MFRRSAPCSAIVVFAALLGVLGIGASSAVADGPAWNVRTIAAPANLLPGGEGEVVVTVTNLGDATAQASAADPIRIATTLPEGVTETSIKGYEWATLNGEVTPPEFACEEASLVCEATSGVVLPYDQMEIVIHVSIGEHASSGMVGISVSGGGASSLSVSDPLTVSDTPTKFGVERLEMTPLNADGSFDTQAGSHPFQLTTTVALNQILNRETGGPEQAALIKDQTFNLPPGLIGNPESVPQCPLNEFQGGRNGQINRCPADTQVGVSAVMLSFQGTNLRGEFPQPSALVSPVSNLVPSPGEPARFGFLIETFRGAVPVFLDTSVRTGGDYGVVVSVNNISQALGLVGAQLSLWGDPGDPRHDLARGYCLATGAFGVNGCEQVAVEQAAFLTLPPSCSGLSNPLTTSMTATSWSEPTVDSSSTYALHDSAGLPVGLDGCGRLPFDPSISVTPDTQSASTPSGLTVGVHVDQQAALNPSGLADADVKDTTVALPVGVGLNPAAADSLESCTDVAEPGRPEGEIALGSRAPIACPEASKVGTASIKTPLLANPLEGAVYLAAQNQNPFGSLVALYIVVEDPVSGTLIKIAGEVKLDPVTGQLVSTFDNAPQLPFEDLKLNFFGGDRAPVATPASCGAYTTTASIAPSSGNESATPSSTFDITSGPNGSACSAPLPFNPGFEAGTTNIQAGAFSNFTLTMHRPDADQTLAGLSVQLPEGMAGSLSKVELCPEPQASEGNCPAASLIGHTVVSAGLGNDPFTVEGGQVFITGPYKGAPFGLSILNPAKAGPFNLGYVVVRAKIEVNPTTAALHIVSDPLPTIKDGIPLQIQNVNVTVDKPEFTFNPTNCSPMKLTGTMTSTEGASSSVETPFQVTNCAALAFKPEFSVSTSGKTSRPDGASLDVKLTYPAGSGRANIAKVKVELPKQLPSRLTTLQKACTEAAFDGNPESCPAASKVGEAVATTPILAGGLTGPAYFVSHGGAKFPELIVVLKGEDGVTVDLHGETFISKAGITSSTFATVPDVPVGSFELKLPQGPYSALAATGNLCEDKLAMPTEFVAQNGAEIHETTKIEITGCTKHKRSSKKKAHRRAAHKRRGRRG
jgi:hypothetical protein